MLKCSHVYFFALVAVLLWERSKVKLKGKLKTRVTHVEWQDNISDKLAFIHTRTAT